MPKPKARLPRFASEVASLNPRAATRHPSDPRIVADTIRMILELPDASYCRVDAQRGLANLWHLIPVELRRRAVGGFPRSRATWAALADALAATGSTPNAAAPAVGNIISAVVAAGRYHVTVGTIGLLVRQHKLTDHRLPDHKRNEAHRVDESAVAGRFKKR